MLKYITVLLVSLIITMVMYNIPFLLKQSVNIHSNKQETPSHINELLQKKELNEKEFSELKKYSDSLVRGPSIESQQLSKQTYRQIRLKTIYLVLFIWIAYFFFAPNSWKFYMLSIFSPIAFYLYGSIINLELLMIFVVGLVVFFIKSINRKMKPKKSKGSDSID